MPDELEFIPEEQEWVEPPPPAVRGRGAAENPAVRFERLHFEPDPELFAGRPRSPARRDGLRTAVRPRPVGWSPSA